MAVLPDQSLVHAAIVIGILLELPHLTLLRQLLTRREHAKRLPSDKQSHDSQESPLRPAPNSARRLRKEKT
ncbi:Uncharacterised protein [Serratia liquefaciens]|nr:Uncharacterised protein [Serratia liquefaciens]